MKYIKKGTNKYLQSLINSPLSTQENSIIIIIH